MRGIDFSSWQSVMTTVIGLAVFTLIGVGIRLVMMLTIQQRRERANRQINERLKTLMAAYKVLGGSFTGDLMVDPTHLRDLRKRAPGAATPGDEKVLDLNDADGSDRTRRIRDAVEAALSDIILLGTERHIRLAEQAASELVAGRPVHTNDLVVSLRDFIRSALDLDPIPADIGIPQQGPTRPGSGNAKGGNNGKGEGRDNTGTGKGGDMAMGAGLGMGVGLGVGHVGDLDDEASPEGAPK